MTNQNDVENVCLNCSSSKRKECLIDKNLDCHFQLKNLILFFIGFMVFGVPAILGIILSGFGLLVIVWIMYMIFFLQIWENRILCSHCPYYAEEGRILRCHANYGLFKLWKYNPHPMSRLEQFQFLIGVGIFVGFPIPWMILGNQFTLLTLSLIGAAIFILILITKLCIRCVNFSCPLNRVPKETRNRFLIRNPAMQKAWNKKRKEM
jgi:hypothetical protein